MSSRKTEALGTASALASTPAVTVTVQYISFFSFSPGFSYHDARLQRPGVWVERRRDIGDLSVEAAGVSVSLHNYVIAAANILQVGLVNICENPDGAEVGDGEGLRLACLHNLTGRDQPLDDFTADGSQYRNLR